MWNAKWVVMVITGRCNECWFEFMVASCIAQTLGKNANIKWKAMSKKQLRQIKKTRLNTKTGAVEYVGAYAK